MQVIGGGICGDNMVLDETTRNGHGQVLSMGRVESEGEVDFYWTDEAKNRNEFGGGKPKNLLMCLQGETGFASFVTMSGVVGEKKAAARIMSKLHATEAFNTVPEPLCPSWLLYEINDDTLALRLTHWFPLNADPNGNPHAWLYSYPVVRDTLKIILRNYNIQSLQFLTTNSIRKFIDKDAEGFADLPAGEIVVYDFATDDTIGNNKLDGDLVLTTPTWAFPYMFSQMIPNTLASVICVGVDIEDRDMIDTTAVAGLMSYCTEVLDLPINEEKMKEVIDVLLEVNDEIEAEDARMLKRVVQSKRNEDVGGMFG